MSTSNTQLNQLRIPLDEIQEATNNFSEKNIIGKGDFGYVYKGRQVMDHGELVNFSVRRLDRNQGQGDVEFWTEISVLSSLKHQNIVSLIGFCDEKGEKIIITTFAAKGSLCMYLSDPALTWIHRMKIAIAVAEAISYLHYEEGRSYSIIHRNINSSTILLDDNFEAMLSGFEFSIKHSVDRMERYISSEIIRTQGYIAPETLKSGVTTQMSDVYSYGVVLCEILCGRKEFLPDESEDNKFLAPLVRFHHENETLVQAGIIHPDLRNQINSRICYRFGKLACDCTKEDPVERPDMSQILADLRVIHVNKFKHLKIGLIDIKKATKNFSEEYAARSEYDYCKFYDTKLECFDREYNFSLERKNKGKLPKKNYDVRIKRIIGNDMHTKHKFYKEIEIQGTCMHENIQPLLGFCNEGGHVIFVYEYPVDCNYLSTILNERFLTWEIRLKICLDIARGLNYMHNEMEDQKMVIHGKISSGVIVWDAKRCRAIITEFGLSIFFPFEDEIEFCGINVEREMYLLLDPEFGVTGKPTKEIDIYCFGLVMFEILCGKTYKELWLTNSDNVAQQWLKEGIIKQKMARIIREENLDNKKFLKKGPNEESLDTFIKITEQCLGKTQNKRPTLQVIIQELQKALLFQKNHKDPLRMSFEDIKLATQSFSRANDIGGGGFGRVYKGELASEHGSSTIVAKRLDTRLGQGDQQFYNELHILSEYKHENVIGLVGYNNDEQERIIVYEYASKGSLDNYLNDVSLTWIKRLIICINVARGLAFLHGGVREHEAVIHRDMKTANILLFDDWKAKVADFGLSLIFTISDETDYVIDHVSGTRGYCDPVYQKSGFLTKESDIYSLGVILFEILYGKSTYEIKQRENQFLHSLVQQRLEEGRLDEVVFNAIKNQIVPKALATFQTIAYQCLDDDREKRPTAEDVLVQLQKALIMQLGGSLSKTKKKDSGGFAVGKKKLKIRMTPLVKS